MTEYLMASGGGDWAWNNASTTVVTYPNVVGYSGVATNTPLTFIYEPPPASVIPRDDDLSWLDGRIGELVNFSRLAVA